MPRGAPPKLLVDETPLDGARIDVDRRIGWVLRMARDLAPGSPGLRETAAHLGVPTTLLHRVETGVVRSGRVTRAYEEHLGLPPVSLRAPIDVVCRGFPYAVADRDPGPVVTTVGEMSALTGRVAEAAPTGGDWWQWARALSDARAIGLPLGLATELVDRLVGELNRSVGPAYPTRYEALSLLRCGPYAGVVIEVARRRLDDPHVQVLYDLMSAVGEAATPDAVRWCLDLLADPRDRVVAGAALALENMGETSADAHFWAPLVAPMLAAFDSTQPGCAAWRWLSHLLRLVPPRQLAAHGRRPGQPLAPLSDGPPPTHDVHWTAAERMSTAVTAGVGIREEPMLTRLLWEVALGPHETRAVTSSLLLGALPPLALACADQVAELAESVEDDLLRERAAGRLTGLVSRTAPAAAQRWLTGEDAVLREASLRLAGNADLEVPVDVVTAGLAADPSGVLYVLGMAGHALVAELAADAADPVVRGAARWWLAQGSRIVS